MKTVTLEVRKSGEAAADFVRIWKSRKADTSARISFTSPELLWKVLTARRWQLINGMAGQGPMTLREAARMGADARTARRDAEALLVAGLIRKTSDGRFEFPFETVHVRYVLRAGS